MAEISFHLSGFPALLLFAALGYIFLYLPLRLVVTLIAHGKRRAAKKLQLQRQTIVAAYEPPAGLSPAEMGFMYDAKLSAAEVFATITDLEQRGLITTATRNNQLFLTGIKAGRFALDNFESWLLGFLEPQVGKPITKRLLKRANRRGRQVINEQLQKQGYFIPTLEQIKKFTIRYLSALGLLIGLTTLAIFPQSWNEVAGIILLVVFLFPAYILAAFFLYIKFQKIDGAAWLGTPKLKKIWPDIEGYRQFIKLVELDNLQFETKETRTAVKNKALPYTIALGFNTGWRKQLK